ncbi:AMP-binding protein [Azospirillum himalayense]|uniref:AMP-binding protein n=1 Tax=Azospirillum himalayense TaxID=654847 RepID=A0ABW0GF70_9PROT
MQDIALEDRVVSLQLRRAAERTPDSVFLQFPSTAFTYGSFELRTNAVANSLTQLGLGKGGRLAIFGRNSPEFLEAWFSAAKLGALYVPINTEYRGEVLRHQLDNAEVTHIVVDPDYLDRLDAVIDTLPRLRHVLVTQAAEAPERLARLTTVQPFDSLRAGSQSDPGVTVAFDDPHAISFTSGTTGPSKGVLALNAHVVRFGHDWGRSLAYQPHEAVYTPLPLFHAIAAWLGVIPTLLNGARIAIAPRFSASTYWDEVRAAKADIAHGIFSMVPILLKQPPRPDDADQPARAFYNGNENPAFEERFRCRIVEAYGATETGIVASTAIGEARVPKSCGRPNTETFEVAIVDDLDRPVPPGTVGEILVRPKEPFSMFREYHGRPDATRDAFRNLWFHTGDNGKIDGDGYLYFIDRKKDAIRRRGENISSYELEFAVNQHPDVLECAAVSVLSDLGEDEVKVVIVPKPGSAITAEAFWDFCDRTMPRFWVPSFLEIRDALPKTANGKVQKQFLKPHDAGDSLYARDWKSGAIRKV